MSDNQTALPRTRLSSVVSIFLPAAREMRPLALATFVNTVGSGLSMTIMPLYLSRVAGLSVSEIGLAGGIAAFFGLLCGIPAGLLADNRGPREVQVGLLVAMGVVALGYPLVTGFWMYLVLAMVSRGLDRGVATVAATMIAGATKGPERVQTRAALRVALNFGLTIGGGLSAIALWIDTPTAYRVNLVIDGLTFVVAAAMYLLLPKVPPVPREAAASPILALRDRRYVVVTLLLSVLQMNVAIRYMALPLWITLHTDLPRTSVAAFVVLNTLGLFLLQVPVARLATGIAPSVRLARVSGLALLAACVAFGLAGDGPVWIAALLMVVGALSHLLGELLSASVQFCLSFELAQENAQGQYQGLSQTGLGLGLAVASPVMALLPLRLGLPGWVVLGLMFVAAGLLVAPAVRLLPGLSPHPSTATAS